ncbi:hypothetical protein [Sulfuriferula plumbiphila]|uniref:hypothetical protein n=1 Tax=Sulfuriferula plumbiphila TaxID=171865 RepID=UPI003530A11B
MAMRGGTALHQVHLAPVMRYSEDIGLVLVKPMQPDVLDQHLRRVLKSGLGNPMRSPAADTWLAFRNVLQPSRILRTAYKFRRTRRPESNRTSPGRKRQSPEEEFGLEFCNNGNINLNRCKQPNGPSGLH